MLGVFNLVNGGAAVLVLALALAPVVVNIIVCCNGIKLVFSNSSVSKDGYNGIEMSFGQPQMSNSGRQGNEGGSSISIFDLSSSSSSSSILLNHPFNLGQPRMLMYLRDGHIVLDIIEG